MKYALISEEQVKQIQFALQEIKDSKLLKEQPLSNWVKALAMIQTLKPSEPVAWGIANTRPTEKQPLMMVMLDKPSPSHLVVPLYAPTQEATG